MIKTTVIIPYKNNSDALRRAVKSVLEQTVTVKIIIIDDGSDESQKAERVIETFNVNTVKIIYNHISLGGGEARNIGIRNADTRFVAFLDCDDYWDKDKIEAQELMFSKLQDPKKYVLYSSIKVVNEKMETIKEYINNGYIHSFSDYVFIKGGLIQTSSLFLEKELALQNEFNPNLKRHQDYDFCLKLESQGAVFLCCNTTFSYWVISDDPLIALKKGYDYTLSIEFYKKYKHLMTTKAGYAFLVKVPFWFCFKQKKKGAFFIYLLKNCGFKTTMMAFIELLKLIFSKWIKSNVKQN